MENEKQRAKHAWYCDDGKPHKWQYLGKDAQEYRCENCGVFVSKAELKDATEVKK